MHRLQVGHDLFISSMASKISHARPTSRFWPVPHSVGIILNTCTACTGLSGWSITANVIHLLIYFPAPSSRCRSWHTPQPEQKPRPSRKRKRARCDCCVCRIVTSRYWEVRSGYHGNDFFHKTLDFFAVCSVCIGHNLTFELAPIFRRPGFCFKKIQYGSVLYFFLFLRYQFVVIAWMGCINFEKCQS